MLILASTTDLIKVITGSALNLDVHASWLDFNGTTVTPGATDTLISTATTTTVVASPASSTQRNVKTLTFHNRDATSSNLITIEHTSSVGPTTVVLHAITLPAGYTFATDGVNWLLLDANGNQVVSSNTPGRFLKATFMSSGTTFTTSASTNTIKIKMVGGGGGGAGCTTVASAASCGGGGGSGAYLEKTVAVQPNTAYTYAIGALGAGASGALGGTGGNTTFTVGATTYTAPGGGGAPVATATVTVNTVYLGGAGASVSTNGDLNTAGQPGDPGFFTSVTGPNGWSGNGAFSQWGGGGIGLKNAAANGNAASGFGAGGGGASTAASAVRTGGNGTVGAILVEEYS